ncbi:MAG: helix-turn-helix domain-containing protein [Parcubacteria group bacterium]
MTHSMETFTTRALRGHGTLGERLRRVREERSESLETAAADVRIRKEYLSALEESNYLSLPGPVYVKSFLRRYADHLGVNADMVMRLYEGEAGVLQKQEKRQLAQGLHRKPQMPRIILTPRHLKRIAIELIILGILVYLGFEIQRIIAPPELIIELPSDNIRVTERSLQIRGTTEPEAILHVNGEEVIPTETGSFEDVVELTEGLNTIVITAQKSRSSVVEVLRSVLFEKPSEN